jgi:hypothetical protein
MGKRSSTLKSAPVAGQMLWHWLIVKDTGSEMRFLTLNIGGYSRTLPVFSSEDTALRMLPSSGGWRVRKTGGGELISVLCGPCSDATMVALDPSPELIDAGMVQLVSESTDVFLEVLLRKGRARHHDSLARRRANIPLVRRSKHPLARRGRLESSSGPPI